MLSRGMGMGRAYDNCETCRMYMLRLVAMSGSDNDLELTAGAAGSPQATSSGT